jgi:hypothetical protein
MSTTWETIEERERRVRGTRTTSTILRAAEQIPAAESLKAAFADRPFVSREDLRSITREWDQGPVITIYLNASDDRPLLSIFDSLRHGQLEVRKPYIDSLPHAQRLRIPEDLAEVRAFLEGWQPEGSRAILIFKRGTQLNRVMPLPVRVADSMTIDIDPYIEPLEAIMEEQRRTVVVDLSKEKTTLSIYELGFEEPIQIITSSIPRDELEVSRREEVQRHQLTHLQWHLKASAQAADRLFRERGGDLVALIGEEGLVREFEDYLPKALQQRLVTVSRLSPEAGPNERHAALGHALAEQRKKDEEAALGELGFYQGHGRLAAGLEMVLGAANLFLMRQLYVNDQLAMAGYICRDHHFLSLAAGVCPFDDRPLLASEDVIDELVEFARLHGVEVMLVMYRQDLLVPYQGVAAVLVTATAIDQLRAVSVTSG